MLPFGRCFPCQAGNIPILHPANIFRSAWKIDTDPTCGLYRHTFTAFVFANNGVCVVTLCRFFINNRQFRPGLGRQKFFYHGAGSGIGNNHPAD